MWISKLTIDSYASFDRPDPILFSPGINLIVGANNSGKSSILRSVTHRSFKIGTVARKLIFQVRLAHRS